MRPYFFSAQQFYTYGNLVKPELRIEIGNMYKFSCKSLLEYVYNHEINESTFSELTEKYEHFDYKKTKLQVVEIAVNEGTNKSFITSVLTELVQNSVDAIRSTGSLNKDIDITITDNAISVRDYVGFDDIINILIPFLSSKNPNDPNVTGEMGTGFFNVYRQPWTRFVVIVTVKNGKKKTVKATPLHENGIVYDIEYKVTIENTDFNKNNMTEISIFLNRDNTILAQTITDATVFTHSYLSFIRSANIKLNGSPVNTTYEICYPEQGVTDPKYFNIGQVMTVESKTVCSYILTNDIPFMPLEDFISSLNSELLSTLFDKYGRNSIIINLNKSVYKPTQAKK